MFTNDEDIRFIGTTYLLDLLRLKLSKTRMYIYTYVFLNSHLNHFYLNLSVYFTTSIICYNKAAFSMTKDL